MTEAKGMRNLYTCQACGGQIMTINAVEGTTPFQIGCRVTPDCRGGMVSAFYRLGPTPLSPEWEWFRPTNGQAKRLDRRYPGTREHVRLGGLLLRPISRQRVDPVGVAG